MGTTKFSVIVPVYNVESYLPKCLDSILAQTYTDYELIVVDDGSTDGSPQICRSYAERDPRVKVIYKENGGLSDARNCGMDASGGNYFVFIDSDDWIEPDALEHMEAALKEQPDVVITTLMEYDENSGETKVNDRDFREYISRHPMDKADVLRWTCRRSRNTWPAQKYVVSRAFAEKYGLRFSKGRLHEDMDWTSKCHYYGTSFAFVTEPWYYHRLNRVNSITSSVNVKHFIDMIEMAGIHAACPQGVPEKTHKEMFRRFMCSTYAWLRYTKNCTDSQLSEVEACLERNRHILKCAPKLWNKGFVFVYKVFGAKAAFKLLRRF